MGLRVRCSPEHFETIMGDLIARGALIVTSKIEPACGEIRATAPLARLIGYGRSLARITAGTAREVMWLSHYARATDAHTVRREL
jgi:translation elongation factor EF-G